MNLLYLSEANLKERMLIQDLVFNFSYEEKTILIHDSFAGNLRDTRFVNKRISALFSEAMVYNNAFSSDQRGFFKTENDQLVPNQVLIKKILHPIQLLILAPILKEGVESRLLDPFILLRSLRDAYEVEEITFFAQNPMSAMVSKPQVILTEEDRNKLLGIYEEEKDAIDLAFSFRPSILASPSNYSKGTDKKS